MGKQPGAGDKSKQDELEPDDDQNLDGDDGDDGEGGDAGEGGDDGKQGKTKKDEPSEEDMSKWTPEQVKDYVKSLRKENAKHRTEGKGSKQELADLRKKFTSFESGIKKALGIEEELSAEEQATALDEQLGTQVVRSKVTELAYENAVPWQHRKYFEFLILEKMDQLDEGEELDAEALDDVLTQVKALGAGGKKATGLPGGGKGGNPPDPKEGEELDVDDFETMTISERTTLYRKNPELYKQLMAERRKPKKKSS